MVNTRRYHPAVADDLAAATTYYDEISLDLGNRFRKAVRERIQRIAERPESFGRIHEQLRAAMVERFPYVIVFEYDSKTVAILGVLHASSDRGRWFERRRQ
jgi:plasmid stabilization system protein ParE